MKKAIIFDADGTLWDVEHRLHFLEGEIPDWDSFHDALVDDKINEAVAWLAMMIQTARHEMAAGDEIAWLLCTARHEKYLEATQFKLDETNLSPDKIYIRDNNDTRPDHIVKEEMYLQMLEDGYDPILVVDDRPSVCDMWRDFGLTVLQCAYRDARGRYDGKVMLRLIIGPSGAGKTTYCAANFKPGEIISTDFIREEEGLGHSPDDMALAFKLARGYAKTRIDAGLPTVIDATNLRQKDRMKFVDIVPKGGLIEYHLINRDYDEKIASMGDRNRDIVDRHHAYFRDVTMKDMKNADGLPNVIIIDKRKKK